MIHMTYPRFDKNELLVALTTLLTLSLILNALLLHALYYPPTIYSEPTGLDASWPYTIEVPPNCKLQVAIHYHSHFTYYGQSITNLYLIECGDTTLACKIYAKWNNTYYSSYHIINHSSSILAFAHIWDTNARIPENGQDPDIFRHSFSYSVLLLHLSEP